MRHEVRSPFLRIAGVALALAGALAASCGGSSTTDDGGEASSLTPQGGGGKSGSGAGGSSAGGSSAGGSSAGGSSAGGQGGASAGGASAGGSSAGGSSAGGNSMGKPCMPACVAPQTCSAVGKCIDPGTCELNSDCGGGLVCNTTTKKCEPGSQCGVTEVSSDQVPPNLLVVLDRSCSMKGNVNGKTKWQIAVEALTKLTTEYKDKIRFGLIMFPDIEGNKCLQDAPFLMHVTPGNEAKIQQILKASLSAQDQYFPDGPCVTNIDTAIEQAATEPAFNDKDRKSFALLLTDGNQAGCSDAGGDAGTTQIITDMNKKGVGTFVIGFDAAIDPTQLNIFAKAGGHPNPDPQLDFYKAEDAASLDAALTAIAKQTLGCTFALNGVPPDPNSIFVFFENTKQVAKDKTHQNGWDYDVASNQVTFYGAACTALKDGQVTDLDIVFGCPGGSTGVGGQGGSGGNGAGGAPPGCKSGLACDSTHLCPDDPIQGPGLCDAGCCTYLKID